MQHTDASIGSNEHLKIPSRVEAAQALEQILALDLPALYRQAYRLLCNRADADDAVQDALLAAYTHLDQFKGQSQMSSWVIAIVLNSACGCGRAYGAFIYLSTSPSEGSDHVTIRAIHRYAAFPRR